MTAVVQIVDAVGSSTVLFDLNRRVYGTSLGRGSELARVAQQQSGDQPFRWSPGPAGDEPVELATRTITVPVVVLAATANGVATLAQQLQDLVSSRFVLRLQRHGSTVPVWLRCAAGALDLPTQMGAAEHTTVVQGALTAQTEAYALGARVDVGAATITQNPASGTPFVWDINSVAGDSLTPLVLRTGHSSFIGTEDKTLITCRRRGTPSSLSGLVVQGESATLASSGPATSTFTGDSTFSGSSGARATYDVDGDWTASFSFSGLTGVQAPGLYRCLVRVRRSGEAAGQLFTLAATAGPVRLAESFIAGGNDTRIIDLGLLQVPVGQPPFLAAPQSPTSATGPTIVLTITKQTTTVTASSPVFDLDWMGLFPSDQGAGVLEVAPTLSGTIVVDGYDHQARVYSADPYTGSTPSAVGTTGVTWLGGVPRLQPGSNRLYVVCGLGATSSSSRSPSSSMQLEASYWPRYAGLG